MNKKEIQAAIEEENALWRASIKRLYELKDLEALYDLRDGPDDTDDVRDFLEERIKKLEEELNKEEKSQAE